MRTALWILCGWLYSCISTAADDTPRAPDTPEAGSIRLEQLTFLGFDCRDDCRGHKAGFAWAEMNGIADGGACTGAASTFTDGCRAYAEISGMPRDAGYDWAAENEVGDERACDGAGKSFAAGCRDYVRASYRVTHRYAVPASPEGSNGFHSSSACDSRSATTHSTTALNPSPQWLPGTRMFSCIAGSPSNFAWCSGTTPSLAE